MLVDKDFYHTIYLYYFRMMNKKFQNLVLKGIILAGLLYYIHSDLKRLSSKPYGPVYKPKAIGTGAAQRPPEDSFQKVRPDL